MIKLFPTKKEKIALKLYNSLYVKEYLLENLTLNGETIDAIIISVLGIFIFRIFDSKKESKINIDEELKKLNNQKEFISKFTNNILNVDYFLVSDDKTVYKNDVIEIKEFKDYISSFKPIVKNEVVEELRKKLLDYNNIK